LEERQVAHVTTCALHHTLQEASVDDRYVYGRAVPHVCRGIQHGGVEGRARASQYAATVKRKMADDCFEEVRGK
jgi:hypothetical protein